MRWSQKILKGCSEGVKKTGVFCFETIAVILAVLLIVVGLLAWRLHTGPLYISYFTPTIQEVIDKAELDVDISFSDAAIIWPAIDKPLMIQLENIQVSNPQGLRLAQINQAGLGLSITGLFQGEIRPESITLFRPDFYVIRNEQGRFLLDFEDQAEPETLDNSLDLLKFLDVLAGYETEAGQYGVLQNLKEISVQDGKLRFSDLLNNQFWNVPTINFDFSRMEEGFGGRLDFSLKTANNKTPFSSRLLYTKGNEDRLEKGLLSWSVNVDALPIQDFINDFEALAPLQGTTTPLSLSAEIRLNRDFDLLGLRATMGASEGVLAIDDVFSGPFPVDDLAVSLSYNDETGIAQLSQARLLSGDVELGLEAKWQLTSRQDNFSLNATFNRVPTDKVLLFWPVDAQKNARLWVENHIEQGFVKNGNLNISASLDFSNEAPLSIDSLSGGFGYEGLRLKFLPEMPPIENIKGNAEIGLKALIFNVDEGQVDGLDLAQSRAKIYNFDYAQADKELLDLSIGKLSGDVVTLARLLDREPLGLITPMGREVSDFGGDFEGSFALSFPLAKDLALEDVSYDVQASSDNFSLKNIYNELALDQGDVSLKVGEQNLSVSGAARLGGTIPLNQLDMRMDLSGTQAIENQIAFNTTLSPRDLNTLVLGDDSLGEYLSGTASIDFVLRDKRSGSDVIDLKSDLTNLSINLKDTLGYIKPASQSMAASAKIILSADGDLERVEGLKASSNTDDLLITGEARFSKDQDIQSADFPTVRFGQNNFALKVDKLGPKQTQISVEGASASIAPLLEDQVSDVNEDLIPSDGPIEVHQDIKPPMTYIIGIDLDTLYAADNKQFRQINLYSEFNQYWDIERLELDTRFANNQLRVRYRSDVQSGLKRLKIQSDNAGELLNRLGTEASLKGGRLFVRAQATADEPNVLKGPVLIKDIVAIEAPIIARLLNALSIDGLANLLNNRDQGLKFDRIATEIQWDQRGRATQSGDIIRLRDGVTKSDSLGLTFEGNIKPSTGQIDIRGTIVPVSDINRFMASIPIVGDIITMGAGDAIFAATYKIEGMSENPSVSVNPRATLAPGFLRKIFFESNIDEDSFADQDLLPAQ